MTTSSVLTFLRFETTFNFKNKIEPESQFPAITICNINSFDTSNSYANHYLIEKLKANNIPPEIQLNENDMATKNLSTVTTLLKAIIMSEKNFENFNLTRAELGFSIETMLISCFYNNIQCKASDFQLVFTFEYGNCYTFNNKIKSLKKTKISGIGTGLELELFSGTSSINFIIKLK